MAKFIMREGPSNLGGASGKLYPHLMATGVLGLDELAEEISHSSTFTPADVKGLVAALADEIARGVARGRTVRVDGIGTFRATLAVNDFAEEETAQSDTHRNAGSVHYDNVRYRADKGLVAAVGQWGHLERVMPRKRPAQLFPPDADERKALARNYLEAHAFMTVADYQRLTGLNHSAAVRELRRLREADDAFLDIDARRVYVLVK